jgi:hypothetical protein
MAETGTRRFSGELFSFLFSRYSFSRFNRLFHRFQAVVSQNKEYLIDLFLESLTFAMKDFPEDKFIFAKNTLVDIIESEDTQKKFEHVLSFFNNENNSDFIELLRETNKDKIALLTFYPILISFEMNGKNLGNVVYAHIIFPR